MIATLILTCVLFSGLVCYAIGDDFELKSTDASLSQSALSKSTAEVEFGNLSSESLKSYLSSLKKLNIEITEFINEVEIDGRFYYGHYLLPESDNMSKVVDTYLKIYESGLCDAITDLKARIPKITNKASRESASLVLSDYKTRLNAIERSASFPVTSVIIEGDTVSIEELAQCEQNNSYIDKVIVFK